MARTKLGTAVNRVEKKIMILSGSLLRIRAAVLPKTTPQTSATSIAVTPVYSATSVEVRAEGEELVTETRASEDTPQIKVETPISDNHAFRNRIARTKIN